MTDGVVTFDYSAWGAIYPEFAQSVTAPVASNYFDMAGLFLDNTPCSAVVDLTKRTSILYMITSHLAALFSPVNGQPASVLVGRIANATEGSVSVATELEGMGKNEAWWVQTKYGFMAWQAMAPYRVARYFPPPQVPLNQQSYPFYPFNVGPLGGFPWVR